jgi:hypothetical protein
MENQQREFKIDISPANTFESGIEFQGHVRHGAEFDAKVQGLGELYQNSDITLGLRFLLNKPEDGEKIKEAVNTHINNFKEQSVMLNGLLEQGASFDVRVAGNELFLDVHVSGAAAEQFKALPFYDQINLQAQQYGGKFDIAFATGFDPVKLLTESFDDLLGQLLRFRIQGNGQSQNLQNLVSYVRGLVNELAGSQKSKDAAMALGLLSIVKNAGFDFHYDVDSLRELIQEAIGKKLGDEEARGMLTGYQGMANEFLPQAQAMAGFFLAPYLEELRGINLGAFEAHVYVPKFRMYLNFNLNIPSLNGFLNQNFLA